MRRRLRNIYCNRGEWWWQQWVQLLSH